MGEDGAADMLRLCKRGRLVTGGRSVVGQGCTKACSKTAIGLAK